MCGVANVQFLIGLPPPGNLRWPTPTTSPPNFIVESGYLALSGEVCLAKLEDSTDVTAMAVGIKSNASNLNDMLPAGLSAVM